MIASFGIYIFWAYVVGIIIASHNVAYMNRKDKELGIKKKWLPTVVLSLCGWTTVFITLFVMWDDRQEEKARQKRIDKICESGL